MALPEFVLWLHWRHCLLYASLRTIPGGSAAMLQRLFCWLPRGNLGRKWLWLLHVVSWRRLLPKEHPMPSVWSFFCGERWDVQSIAPHLEGSAWLVVSLSLIGSSWWMILAQVAESMKAEGSSLVALLMPSDSTGRETCVQVMPSSAIIVNQPNWPMHSAIPTSDNMYLSCTTISLFSHMTSYKASHHCRLLLH